MVQGGLLGWECGRVEWIAEEVKLARASVQKQVEAQALRKLIAASNIPGRVTDRAALPIASNVSRLRASPRRYLPVAAAKAVSLNLKAASPV